MAHEIKIGQICRFIICESDKSVRIASTTIRLFSLKRFLINASVVIDNSIFPTLTVVAYLTELKVSKMTYSSNVMNTVLLGISSGLWITTDI